MWIIHQISFLNPETVSKNIKPTLHVTDNQGEGRSIQIDISTEDIRKLSIGQLEDIANGKLTVAEALQ